MAASYFHGIKLSGIIDKAKYLFVKDTNGIMGEKNAEVSGQDFLDSLSSKVLTVDTNDSSEEQVVQLTNADTLGNTITADTVNGKINYSDALSLSEIKSASSLTNKVASAQSVKDAEANLNNSIESLTQTLTDGLNKKTYSERFFTIIGTKIIKPSKGNQLLFFYALSGISDSSVFAGVIFKQQPTNTTGYMRSVWGNVPWTNIAYTSNGIEMTFNNTYTSIVIMSCDDFDIA